MHFGVVLDNNFQRTYATTLAGDGATIFVSTTSLSRFGPNSRTRGHLNCRTGTLL